MEMDMIGDDGSESWRQVQVRFVTRQQFPFKAPPYSITVPSNLTRMGMSAVLNNLVKAANPDWDHEPFDFLIDGELVRMSLGQFLLVKCISAEKTLEIEYVKAVAPRKKEEPSLHDDWVSAVDGSDPRCVVTGCYDGLGRVWKEGKLCTSILEGHSDAITSVRIISQENDSDRRLATASKDRTLRLWKLDAEETLGQPMKVRPYRILRGHNAAVQSVAAYPSRNMLCSSSWDCTIKLWRTNEFDVDDDSMPIKKRKVDDKSEDSLFEGEAVSTFVGHTQCVSSVVWPQLVTIYSTSWDHSVRRWDVESGKDQLNIFCGKALNCIDVGGESSALIAAGSSDPILRIWDPRKPGTSAPIFQFSAHTSWISACKWHGKSWFHLLSSSYDGKVMLWDLRTAFPLAIIDSHEDKVLCADWWKGDSVISGGADSKLWISCDCSIS